MGALRWMEVHMHSMPLVINDTTVHALEWVCVVGIFASLINITHTMWVRMQEGEYDHIDTHHVQYAWSDDDRYTTTTSIDGLEGEYLYTTTDPQWGVHKAHLGMFDQDCHWC